MLEIYNFIEKNVNEYIYLQRILTNEKAIAPENNGSGELSKCEALIDFLISHGITNLKRLDAPDSRVESGIRPNLIATLEGINNDYTVWVIIHLDVVPSGDLSLWDNNPWEAIEKDGKIYGRGVEDNQQGLISSFAALWAYSSLNIKPKNTLKILFVSDEEVGSKYGIKWILDKYNLFKKEDIIIIPDGGDKEGKTIEIAEKHNLWLEFTTYGKQTHGSTPASGINACLAGSDLAINLHNKLNKKFNKRNILFSPSNSSFEPTMRKSNIDCVNMIPGIDVFSMDCRIIPDYSCDDVLFEVKKICKSIEEKYSVKIIIKILNKSESLTTSKDSEVVKLLSKSLKDVHNIDSEVIGIGGGTVASELRNHGFDSVVWSSLEGMAHMPNEYSLISNLIKDAKTIAYLINL